MLPLDPDAVDQDVDAAEGLGDGPGHLCDSCRRARVEGKPARLAAGRPNVAREPVGFVARRPGDGDPRTTPREAPCDGLADGALAARYEHAPLRDVEEVVERRKIYPGREALLRIEDPHARASAAADMSGPR